MQRTGQAAGAALAAALAAARASGAAAPLHAAAVTAPCAAAAAAASLGSAGWAAAALGLLQPARAGFATQAAERTRWEWMREQGHTINPCNSTLHPAAEAGIEPEGTELAVQDAYTPHSTCWGCGPSAQTGLRLRSFRVRNGLEARVQLPDQYCAFPGIINGGIISTLIDCHGNWTAAIALMDRSCLPAPPLTLTASVLVSFKEPAPPGTPLVVRSNVVEIREGSQPGVGKASVEVDITVSQAAPPEGGAEKLLASATGIFKKLGALRAL
ncbi:hypothetical protein Rsub_11556 [Raphidocelis subcapitata]|uniref:Thioesterase domain-containing protein n=1 Tax=Raphidocelis subcapitata TaxID=307507 RepID=A0A2V0PM68_9CHLO|nr:hypothetical protein Rsub_11556 [Raphidocelis subcapitata]|eukprot:GBF98970.1 hypothetical protein Rsub_11556 [Raphidocelis subcapitata]